MDLHWGTLTRDLDLATARAKATAAIIGAGYQLWNDPNSDYYIVLGGSGEVNITISLAPQEAETFIAVIVDSSNNSAESVRNTVRSLIDTAPAPAPLPKLP